MSAGDGGPGRYPRVDIDPDGPLDAIDLAVLAGVRTAYARRDPVPPDLVERIRFALALEALPETGREFDGAPWIRWPRQTNGCRLDAEPCRLTTELAGSGARGTGDGTTITFECPTLTVMLRLSARDDDAIRVDGWLVPAGTSRVELRTAATTLSTTADGQGRFAFEAVPHGLAQVVAHRADGAARPVVTQPVML